MVKKRTVKPAPSEQSTGYLNPIAVVFGRTLEKMRHSANIEPAQMAAHLGLKYPTYRMIETGAMPFRPARSILLAQVHQLDLQRVAEVSVAVQLLEDKTDSIKNMRDAVNNLFAHAPHLRDALLPDEDIWSLIAKRQPVEDVLRSSGVIDRLERYMRHASNDSTPHNSHPISEVSISGISPHYLETLTDLLESWRHLLPPRVATSQLARFEDKNIRSQRFVRIFGLTKEVAILRHTVEHQHSQFTWEYLLQPQFEFLGILILGASRDAVADHVQLFRTRLREHWRANRPSIRDDEIERALTKLHCHPEPKSHWASELLEGQGEFEQVVAQASDRIVQRRATIPLVNLWLYRLKEPVNTIVYADNMGERAIPYSESASWDRTSRIAQQLEKYWSSDLREAVLPLLFTAPEPSDWTVRVTRILPESARATVLAEPFNAYVGISLGNPALRGDRLKAVLQWVEEHSSQCVIIIGDALHRHNLIAEHDLSEDEALRECCALGDAFLASEKATLDRLSPERFQIRRWHEITGTPSYASLRHATDSVINSDVGVRTALLREAANYVNRRFEKGTQYAASTDRAIALAEEYLREEITAFAVLAQSGYTVDVYPGPELPVLEELRRCTDVPAPLASRVNIELRLEARGGQPWEK